MHTALASGPEFELIESFWRRLGERAAPSGDDCAFVEHGGETLALTADLSVEGTHFRVGWLGFDELGWRAATAALSDLAAVAATPLGILVSLGVPLEWPGEHAREIMTGVGAAAARAGGVVLGGDLVRADRVVIDVTAVGRVTAPVRRGGARAGDDLWVTGVLGGPAAALAAWERRAEPEASARQRFAHPEARIEEARWLCERGARAMIDISDGLLADAAQLAAASGHRVVIEAERVPVHAAADPELALIGGEEYELLVALPPGFSIESARAFERRFGVPVSRVGTVVDGAGVEVRRGGEVVALPEGFRHF